jgi:ComF family protein
MCPHCEGLSPVYGQAKTVALFKGPVRELVLSLKYRDGLFVLEDMVALVRGSPEIARFLHGAVLVPVPLHARRMRERGYNQSELLAEVFLSSLAQGEASVEPVLRRVVDTASQTTFDRRSRRQRMKNAFAAQKGAAITPEKRYVLVDDVFTTGSTLNAAAHALRQAGALKIDVITFAHG